MNFFPVPTGMAMLALISLVVAVISHLRISGFWRASFVSAVITPIAFLVACVFQAGLPDPLKPIAFVYFAGFAFFISIAVGLAFSFKRHFFPVGA